MKHRGPGVRGYPFVIALIVSFLVFGLAVIDVDKSVCVCVCVCVCVSVCV